MRALSPSSRVAGLLLLILVGSLLFRPFGFLCKYVVDTLALGYSFAKTWLLLCFGVLLAVGQERMPPLSKRWPVVFASLLTLMQVVNLAQYLWYCRSYGVNPNSWTALVRDGFWTMSRLEHFHTSKAMLSALPTELALKTDVGYAFGALFPRWFLAAQFVLFCGLLVCCLGACLQMLQRSPTGTGVSFALASFVLVKCVADGGPLVPEVWAALPVFCGVLWGKRGFLSALGGTILYGFTLLLWKEGAFMILLFGLLPAALLLSAPKVADSRRKVALGLMVLALLSPLLAWKFDPRSRLQPSALNTVIYGSQVIEKGWRIHIVSPRAIGEGTSDLLRVVGQLQDSASGHYLVEADVTDSTDPGELCHDLDLELVRHPISWYHGEVRVESEVVVLEGTLEEILESPLITSRQVDIEAGVTKLTLHLRPGVNRDLAVSMLGPKLSLVKNFRLFYP
jgi:hypothetical protein